MDLRLDLNSPRGRPIGSPAACPPYLFFRQELSALKKDNTLIGKATFKVSHSVYINIKFNVYTLKIKDDARFRFHFYLSLHQHQALNNLILKQTKTALKKERFLYNVKSTFKRTADLLYTG
jgi:hypothetical protein